METDRARSACGAVGRSANITMIRVTLPPNLRTLAHADGEVGLELNGTLTQRSLLDAVEAEYPMLRGTMRDHVTQVRPQWSVFLRAAKIYLMNRPMRRCLTPLRTGRSHS